MKFITLCLCALLSLGFIGEIFALIDDFNDGRDDGWKPIQGDWSVIKGEYAQEDTKWTTTTTYETYTRSFWGDENWTNYTVEAKVRIEKGGELAPIIGIFFRVTEKSETGDYYYFRLDQRAAEGPALIKSPNTILLENQTKPCEIGVDYILKVEVEGDFFRCYIDDKLEMEVTDNSFASGAVGVGTFNADGRFDYISVNGPGIAANPVSSKGKLTATWASLKK